MKRILENRIFKNIRWIMAAILAACLIMCSASLPVYASNEPASKNNITWNIEGDTLVISGSGMMSNYTEWNMAPWYEDRESIVSVQISSGITSIGELAFYNCTSLQSIDLPDSITSIGDMSFAGCTSLKSISLSSGLKSIGANSFSRCESLQSIRLPEGLLSLGYQAFYRCSSLTSIRIPATVSNIDSSVFAYCTSLMQATIESSITELPRWTFYGCTSLVNVSLPSSVQEVGENAFKGCDSLKNAYHDGTDDSREEISNQIQTDLPEFTGVTEGSSANIGSSSITTTQPDAEGGIIDIGKEVVETDNSTINITVENKQPQNPSSTNKNEIDITIDATIENEDGWKELIDKTNQYVGYPDRLEDEETTVNKIQVNVHLKSDITIPSNILSSLAGSKVNLNITTSDNTNWSIDMEQVEADNLSKAYDLKYTMIQIEELSKDQKALVGDVMSFLVEFEEDVPFKVTVKIPLGHSYAGHYATICQKPMLKDWEVMQTVVIDGNGDAYFYLDSLDKHTKYMVSIDAEGVDVSEALIPDTLADQYGGLTDEYGNKYVVTGMKSSWGITFKQLTVIIIAVIVLCVVVVGIIMKIMFKMHAQKERLKWMMEDGIPFEEPQRGKKGKRK